VITIREGERRTSIDIAAPRLPVVTVNGVVRDPEGTPVPGATVLTAWAASPFAYFGEGGTVRSDAEGRFTVRLPGRTRYSVRVQLGTPPQMRTAVGECAVGTEPTDCVIVLPTVARPTP
jgi:hypothetical protein